MLGELYDFKLPWLAKWLVKWILAGYVFADAQGSFGRKNFQL